MGQITNPIVKGITVNPVDRQSGPGAGGGALGNNVVLLGATAGTNEAISNAIILGNGAGSGGINDTVSLNGSTIIGVGSAAALTAGNGTGQPLTLLGSNNLTVANHVDNTISIGANLFPAVNPVRFSDDIFIGNNIAPVAAGTVGPFVDSIVLGSNLWAAAATVNLQACVFIGSGVSSATSAGPQYAQDVLIGSAAAQAYTFGNTNVAIGANCVFPSQAIANVLVGAAAHVGADASGTSHNNVVIGENAQSAGGSQNTVIGAGAGSPGNSAATGCVIIGFSAGQGLLATDTSVLVIESSTVGAGTIKALQYGRFDTGNLIFGNSVTGTNRDLQGTNTVKLLNGTKGAAPVGGGYFYVTGGFLHWVDVNGTDSQLSETVAGQLASSALTAFTNNAAAAAGTLSNAPVAGNPTKWIPINDAGTIRNIPAW